MRGTHARMGSRWAYGQVSQSWGFYADEWPHDDLFWKREMRLEKEILIVSPPTKREWDNRQEFKSLKLKTSNNLTVDGQTSLVLSQNIWHFHVKVLNLFWAISIKKISRNRKVYSPSVPRPKGNMWVFVLALHDWKILYCIFHFNQYRDSCEWWTPWKKEHRIPSKHGFIGAWKAMRLLWLFRESLCST